MNFLKTLWPLFMDVVQLSQGWIHFEEAVYFLPLSSQKFLVLILSTSERWKAESTLEPPVVLNTEPLDWESSALTTRPAQLWVLIIDSVVQLRWYLVLRYFLPFSNESITVLSWKCDGTSFMASARISSNLSNNFCCNGLIVCKIVHYVDSLSGW